MVVHVLRIDRSGICISNMCQVSRATVCGLVRGILAGSRWDLCIVVRVGLLGSLVVSTEVRGQI